MHRMMLLSLHRIFQHRCSSLSNLPIPQERHPSLEYCFLASTFRYKRTWLTELVISSPCTLEVWILRICRRPFSSGRPISMCTSKRPIEGWTLIHSTTVICIKAIYLDEAELRQSYPFGWSYQWSKYYWADLHHPSTCQQSVNRAISPRTLPSIAYFCQ